MNRKSQLALISIFLAALLGAFASSMISASIFQMSDVSLGSFTIFADQIIIKGGPPSMEMANGTIDGINVVVMNSSEVEITNMRLIKDDLEITATKAVGADVLMKVTKVLASNATFADLTITDIPEFVQSAGGTVTLSDVEITALYMFAETMTMLGMKLTIS